MSRTSYTTLDIMRIRISASTSKLRARDACFSLAQPDLTGAVCSAVLILCSGWLMQQRDAGNDNAKYADQALSLSSVQNTENHQQQQMKVEEDTEAR